MRENGVQTVRIRNFKNLKDVNSELDGNSIFLIGDNEVGKSSFLQAVFSTLSNEGIPKNPITKGEKESEIEIVFKIDNRVYKASRKYTEKNPKGYFELRTDDNMKSNSVTLLSDIVGNISFNPFEFVELSKTSEGRKKQITFIKQLMDPVLVESMEAKDQERNQKYNQRTEANRELKRLELNIKQFPPEELEKYSKEIKVEELNNELQNKMNLLNELSVHQTELKALQERETNAEKVIKEMEAKLKRYKSELKKIVKGKEEKEKEIKKFDSKDLEVEPVKKKIQQSDEHNQKFREIKQNKKLEQDLQETKEQSEKLTNEIDELLKEKKEIIAAANLGIEGLSFEDDQILINGLEMNEDQISTSKIMEIGVHIQKRLNPALRIMQIPRGESLGSERLKQIQEFAKLNEYQLFIEKVDSEKKDLLIKFIEE